MSAYKKTYDDDVFNEMVDATTPDDTDYDVDYIPDEDTPIDFAFEYNSRYDQQVEAGIVVSSYRK